jgi:hypothetical protein
MPLKDLQKGGGVKVHTIKGFADEIKGDAIKGFADEIKGASH